MKRLLSILLAVLMLAVMLPVTAMAAGDPTLGTDNVWKNVTPANVQALLDGEYGSINGTTIELSADTYGQLELGRATKHPGSNTKTHLLKSTGLTEYTIDQIKAEIAAHPQGGAGTPYYVRTMKNVTIKAAEGATVTIGGIKMNSAHVFGANGNVKYDYVLERNVPDTNESFIVVYDASNLRFEGLTFTKVVDIQNLREETSIDGVSFKNCKFNINNITENKTEYYGIRFYDNSNNGKLKNLVVDNCEFNGCRLAVYTHYVCNVSVTNSNFDTTGHNAIAIQTTDKDAPGYQGSCNHGNVVITGNNFNNIGNRIIRFNEPAAGTVITITKNTAVNSGKDVDGKKEVIAAEITPLDGVTVKMAGNKWGENTKFGKGFETVVDEPIPEPSGPIIIYPPTDDTPKTDDQKNPTTGANDFVGIAAAAAVVALLGSAVILRKK